MSNGVSRGVSLASIAKWGHWLYFGVAPNPYATARRHNAKTKY